MASGETPRSAGEGVDLARRAPTSAQRGEPLALETAP